MFIKFLKNIKFSLRIAAYISAIDKVAKTYKFRDGSFTFQNLMVIHKEGRKSYFRSFLILTFINFFTFYLSYHFPYFIAY